MRTSKKILSTVVAATFVSGALIGGAFAQFPDQTVGDLNGNNPVSIQQMQIANAKALRDAGKLNTKSYVNRAAVADFPDQTVGDSNGNTPVPVRVQATRASDSNLTILPFIGDWNGTAKKGFPHQ
ncbi:hypothetical protein K1718_02640 [Roseibium porphyridii]|uniref:DUF4148 domain-containing protein n=1 Tax=Roseibium porphyridii TaxID=2866279 RepID=A0ABY8F459_9HYPH|nr:MULTISPECIES: hypothetical protein [Stappiaceae]QFT29277.1 hypothetical protein FIV00_02150 [Labrenzia sp. THAF82]WFE90266.1 hypothetical protein K1718_02640 [Roseibium sp. KMA01]